MSAKSTYSPDPLVSTKPSVTMLHVDISRSFEKLLQNPCPISTRIKEQVTYILAYFILNFYLYNNVNDRGFNNSHIVPYN